MPVEPRLTQVAIEDEMRLSYLDLGMDLHYAWQTPQPEVKVRK